MRDVGLLKPQSNAVHPNNRRRRLRDRITSDGELVPDDASTSWRELDEYVSVVLNVDLVAKIKI
jgi:hypothetical protein